VTFTLLRNQPYTVQVEDYGNYVFDHWLDTNSTIGDRNVSISSDSSITAVYQSIAPPQGMSKIFVNTEDSFGNPLSRYHVRLWSNGTQINYGYSPHSFIVNNFQAYQVSVDYYVAYVFDHWNDGTTT
jgi:hypothetical protein